MKFAKVFHVEETGQDILFHVDQDEEEENEESSFLVRMTAYFKENTKVSVAVGPMSMEEAQDVIAKATQEAAYSAQAMMNDQLPPRLRL